MPITPIEGITYINQNMQVAATKQIDFQSRLDLQNAAAVEAINNKNNEVEETDKAQESKKLDSDQEHNQEKSDQETGAKEKEIYREYTKKRVITIDDGIDSSYHLLDIIV